MSKLIIKKILEKGLCIRSYSSAAPKLSNKNVGPLLIKCKRSEYNHYYSDYYDKLEEVPLTTKGWKRTKAKGDFFTILPVTEDSQETTYKFSVMGVDKAIVEALKADGIKNATEIQNKAFETIRSGYHVLMAAETGCGKTIGYLLPIIQDIIENKIETEVVNTPKALILVPNRELAYQIGEVASSLGRTSGVNVKIVVGGKTKQQMLSPSFNKIDILVATPGAIGKLSTMGIYKLNEVKYTVLDEADTLVDDSFIDRMSSLIQRTSKSHIILVSATIPRKLPAIFAPIENNLKHVISPKIHKPLLNITQKFLRLTSSAKPSHLLQLTKMNKDPMLIFTNKNETSQWVAFFLRENGLNCSHISGDMNYAVRIDQWNQFVRGDTKILSATDVGSRGLNTLQVRHVLNYDFPIHAADYLHRVGRVGRLGSFSSCKVTNFVCTEMQIKLVQQIELAIRRNQPLPNVDGNITNIIQKNIAKSIQDTV